MAIDMYMKVEGMTGESQDSNHKGWTDVLSFNWGASQPGNMAAGGGGGSGKVNYQDLRIQAPSTNLRPLFSNIVPVENMSRKSSFPYAKRAATRWSIPKSFSKTFW